MTQNALLALLFVVPGLAAGSLLLGARFLGERALH
jgi:hypothetical protein